MHAMWLLSTYAVLVKSKMFFVSQFHSDLFLNLITSTATWSRENGILFQCIRHKISKQATLILKKDTIALFKQNNKSNIKLFCEQYVYLLFCFLFIFILIYLCI